MLHPVLLALDVDGERFDVAVDRLVVAGFTGRDRTAVDAHLAELAAHGVPAPPEVPAFYDVDPGLLTQDEQVLVGHEGTSGEAELAVVCAGGRLLAAVASDHTDRRLERRSIARAKGACTKPIGRQAWELPDDPDDLLLRSWLHDGAGRVLYQEGALRELLPVARIVAAAPGLDPAGSWVLLTGTLPAIGGLRGGGRFEARLADPRRGRALALSYAVRVEDGA